MNRRTFVIVELKLMVSSGLVQVALVHARQFCSTIITFCLRGAPSNGIIINVTMTIN